MPRGAHPFAASAGSPTARGAVSPVAHLT